jgi:glycosyltransferase involved in cell wall biosynthesis
MVSSVKLVELWQELGYRVMVLCMGRPVGREEVSPSLTIERLWDYFIPDPANYGIAPSIFWKVFSVMRREHPVLIVVNKQMYWTTLALPLLHLTGRKVLLLTDVLAGVTWWPRSRFVACVMWIYARTVGRLILKAATHVVFFHPQPFWALEQFGVEEKSSVIPSGVSGSLLLLPRKEHEGITVSYIGRLESVKGVDDFLAAAVKVQRDFPSLRVHVVGWYREHHPLVERYAGKVQFLGLRDDVTNLLLATDIFVLPSYSEGLSNALMEAMAAGCACIASDVGGNCYLIENGVSGFLFPPGDREALASHIRRLVEDPHKRRQLSDGARERIRVAFSWDVVGKQYEELFREFLEKEAKETRETNDTKKFP